MLKNPAARTQVCIVLRTQWYRFCCALVLLSQNISWVHSLSSYDKRCIWAPFSCLAIVIDPYRPAPLNCRGGAHRVISNKDDIAFVTREAQWGVRWTAWWVGSVLLIPIFQVDIGISCPPSCVRIPFSNYFIIVAMWPLLPGNGIPLICLAGGLPWARFVIPNPLRRAKVVHGELDEIRSPFMLPQKNIKSRIKDATLCV